MALIPFAVSLDPNAPVQSLTGQLVLAIPRGEAARVVAAAEATMRKEAEFAAAIRGGAAVWELRGADKAYAALGTVENDAAFDRP